MLQSSRKEMNNKDGVGVLKKNADLEGTMQQWQDKARA